MSLLNPACATAKPVWRDIPPDLIAVASLISGPLHYTTGTPHCRASGALCEMCLNATRLVGQEVVPMVAEELLTRIDRVFGRRYELPHPGDD